MKKGNDFKKIILLPILLTIFSSGDSFISDTDKTINKEYLSAINELRSTSRTCGKYGHFKAVPPLKWSDKLYAASRAHSKDMAATGKMTHSGSGKKSDFVSGGFFSSKSSASDRGKYFGYTYKRGFSYGENIGAGQKTTKDIMNSWNKSAGHCKNIMNPSFREMGMAKVTNPSIKYKYFWTINFGYRK